MKSTESTIPAVSYIRMSSGQQEASPAQQRAEVKKLAERHGCHIIREYFDEAISGDDTKKRKAFRQMIEDAQEKGDFCAILCWDQDRFGRFDSIEAGRWIHPLREAGVWLITVAQGQIDWNDFASRMIYGVIQEGKHQFLIDLSKNVLRGKIKAAQDGRGAALPPYGMDRQFYDKAGAPVKRVPYGERFTRPRDWGMRFVVSQDARAASIVREIFQRVADDGDGLGAIAGDLNRRQVRSPQGKAWSVQTVAGILENRTYTGANVFGGQREGKYHSMGAAGEITRAKGRIEPGSPIIVEGVHDALVDVETFQRATAALEQRKVSGRKPRNNRYVLSSVLRCGHCGGTMAGKGYASDPTKPKYYCCVTGATRPGACRRFQIRQDQIEEYVLGVLESRFLSPDAIEQIKAEVHKQAKARRSHKTQTADLKSQITALDRKIAKGTENLLLADPRDMAELSKLLADWRSERERLQGQIERAAISPNGLTAEQLAERALKRLDHLKQALKTRIPAKVKHVVAESISEIRLWWEPYGKRNKRLARGVIQLRNNLEFFSSGSRAH